MSESGAQVTGQATAMAEVAAVSIAIENGSRHVALTTAQRVMAGIRARVRFATGKHLRDNVAMTENTAGREFLVGFKDAAGGASGHPMVPVWHEFGTKKLPANPSVHDAVNAEREAYVAQQRDVVERALSGASR